MLMSFETTPLAHRWHLPTHPLRRDKRYVVPVLAVSLSHETQTTRNWSTSHVILDDLRLCQQGVVGQEVAGSFTFEGSDQFGLFDASIIKIDRPRGLVLTQFRQLSAIGSQLIAHANQRQAEGEPGGRPKMTIQLACPTVDWSLSGLALAGCPGSFAVGQTVGGTLRSGRTQEIGTFHGVVMRITSDPDIVALRILTRSSECFDLMESAIRKQGIHNNPPSVDTILGITS